MGLYEELPGSYKPKTLKLFTGLEDICALINQNGEKSLSAQGTQWGPQIFTTHSSTKLSPSYRSLWTHSNNAKKSQPQTLSALN